MANLAEAEALLNKISSTNTEIAKVKARVEDKQNTINKILQSANVQSIEQLDQLIANCEAQLDTIMQQAQKEYDETLPKVNEALACLAN